MSDPVRNAVIRAANLREGDRIDRRPIGRRPMADIKGGFKPYPKHATPPTIAAALGDMARHLRKLKPTVRAAKLRKKAAPPGYIHQGFAPVDLDAIKRADALWEMNLRSALKAASP